VGASCSDVEGTIFDIFLGTIVRRTENLSESFLTPRGRLNRASDRVFKALADPTRRAIFERLSGGGELTVGALVKHCGVSQQAVAQHLSTLEFAGLVKSRGGHGRANYYSARPRGAAPLLNWLAHQGILGEQATATRFAKDRKAFRNKTATSSPLPTHTSSAPASLAEPQVDHVEQRREVAVQS
jgi:DNA-binding transcriptional ArsR family regulator